MSNVLHASVFEFLQGLRDTDTLVDLWLTDPPYYGVLKDDWDNQWKSVEEYCAWWQAVAVEMLERTAPTGSLVFFAGLGPASQHAVDVLVAMRSTQWTFRNWLTWSKRRGYGKSHDYINAREEILWYSRSPARTEVVFNKPFTKIPSVFTKTMGGSANPNEFKRVTTVWADTPEPLKAKVSGHPAEKPENVITRLLLAHSNPGQLVADPFCGSGIVGAACTRHSRRYILGDTKPEWAAYSRKRLALDALNDAGDLG